jgi:hypothetical protein
MALITLETQALEHTKMTMPAPTAKRLAQSGRSSDVRLHARIKDVARPGSIKGFFAGALSVLAATAAAGSVTALKAAYFLSHFSY